ncbi:hypothetical protein BAUCODRAFT_119555 [Baudoinia panamericana UAMH 10762]|uniref:Uncharacterized protein n=1 Tax=Baudoinia panamericana (strain UAMH 10762) TaxID=717646 RepID=M2MT08_BAUPA|nr:uncharacterized protein BAUCODRAFT_119555 [Baudoinia panamericana UAMH 10762]EMC99996.1 hypothetical protein BAUCODRAFT_119555 [Baudoinia panamericana UAMH 10762]
MAEHEPQIQITREGYRAVMRIQLTQSKTTAEKRWAQLKAQSWPPWKHERTAMDSFITPEYGMTRVGVTLRRMREAGYGMTAWERAAEMYAGWDVDGTPTIQTRAYMRTEGIPNGPETEVWVARISATRTAQEAWAAYLAYEDAKLPSNPDVLLAIFKKLHSEEQRQAEASGKQHARKSKHVLPGDRREVEPLPPSIHLYTYTRTPVPTVDSFHRQLCISGVTLSGPTLAFIVANASRLQLGFHYLETSPYKPAIHRMLSLDPHVDANDIPVPVFTAVIQLLCRFPNVPMAKKRHKPRPIWPTFYSTEPLLVKQSLNLRHPLVFALELLHIRRPTFRPAWNAVLRGLVHQQTLKSMRFLGESGEMQESESDSGLGNEKGAILAYRLVRRTLAMLQELHVDLDMYGFHYLCIAVENATLACCRILQRDIGTNLAQADQHVADRSAVREAVDLLRSSSHSKRLKNEFALLVGLDTEASQTTPADARLPRLLLAPSTAVLHAYVRALGWMADYAGILAVVKFTVEYRMELLTRQAQERNAEEMVRKVIVATRVFLERSWLENGDGGKVVRETDLQDGDRRLQNLRRLHLPASADTVAEVQALIETVPEWQGWASDEEVEEYCSDWRFRHVRDMS